MNPSLVETVSERILSALRGGQDTQPKTGNGIPVGVSNRHVHLSVADLERLFGAGYQLTRFRDLSQTGEFAANEKVTIIGSGGVLEGVRILGPARDQTQIEISRTDAQKLGLIPPVRLSGQHNGSQKTPGITLAGPKGITVTDKGMIIAARHLHADPVDAGRLGIKDGEMIKLRAGGDRPVVFENVAARVRPGYRIEFHIDVDEANAALLRTGDLVEIVR